jgi:hypothetical protein
MIFALFNTIKKNSLAIAKLPPFTVLEINQDIYSNPGNGNF